MPPDLTPLREFLRRARTASLLVAASANDRPLVQRLSLHQDIVQDFLGVARDAVPAEPDLRPYDPGYKPEPDDLLHVPLAEVEGGSELIADLQRVDQAELFTEDDQVIRHLRFYAIVVGAGERHAIFLRHYSPKKELHCHSAFALMLARGSYSRIVEKVFLFDEAVDCFSWDGLLFIKNVTQFQRIFDYLEGLRRKARTTLQAIHRRIPIDNLNEFEAAVISNSLMLGKLAAIAQKPYLARVTFADVERTITAFGLDVAVARDGGPPRLIFDAGRERRWLILKLLDDDFLGSIMTDERYEVNSKIRAGGSS